MVYKKKPFTSYLQENEVIKRSSFEYYFYLSNHEKRHKLKKLMHSYNIIIQYINSIIACFISC